MDVPLIGRLDGMAARAVPAEDVTRVRGWLLRRSPNNPLKRANSVFPKTGSANTFERDVTICERLYRERGLTPRFQISPASQPRDLSELLLARGYQAHSVTATYVCRLADPTPGPRADGMNISWCDAPDDAWWATHQQAVPIGRAGRMASDAMLRRITQDVAYVRVTQDGAGAAVGMSVQEDGWFGIFYIATAPLARRRGLGRVVVDSLMRRARDRGSRHGYVQVEATNAPALALYHRAGYREHIYDYHYLSHEPRHHSRPAHSRPLSAELTGRRAATPAWPGHDRGQPGVPRELDGAARAGHVGEARGPDSSGERAIDNR